MTERQAPFVAMRTDLRKDERALYLADTAGYSIQEAAGRLFFLWAFCADRRLELAPDDCDGYAVSDAVVIRFLGARGVEAILGGGCDQFALGARRPDGLIYLRGTSETVARFRHWSSRAQSGGLARRNGAHRGDLGRFATETTNVQLEGGDKVVDRLTIDHNLSRNFSTVGISVRWRWSCSHGRRRSGLGNGHVRARGPRRSSTGPTGRRDGGAARATTCRTDHGGV